MPMSIFIAVGTPPDEDGSADLKHVLAVAETVGRNMARPTVVITKSTVPVGTAEKVRAKIAECTDVAFHSLLESRVLEGRGCGR